MKALASILTLGAVALTIAACGSGAQTAQDTSPVGLWGEKTDGQPWMEFSDDGKVTGNDGCNTLTGSWEEDGGDVAFGALAATQMFCEGVDAWLSLATGATVDGDELSFVDGQGLDIGTLNRAD